MWLSWLEQCPIDQKVVDLTASQGTYPGFGFDPRLELVREGNHLVFLSHTDVPLSVSLCLLILL